MKPATGLLNGANDYYPFGMLMPGRSLDTTGLCVTATRYYVKQEMHYANAGTLGSGGGGGAVAFGADTLSNLGSSGVSAHGLSGGLSYTITGLPSNFISLDLYFSYLSGTATVSLYKGTNTGTSGILLKSVTASYTSPAVSLFLAPVTMVIGSTVTVVITMPSGSSRSLFSIDSMRYGWWTNTDVPYLFAQCGSPVDKYEFGFNGQMKSNEIAGVGNQLDFKFRGYDSRIGRFWSVDPLKGQYPWNSTYAFAENDPINYVDLEGLEKPGATAVAIPIPSKPKITVPHTTIPGAIGVYQQLTDILDGRIKDIYANPSRYPESGLAKRVIAERAADAVIGTAISYAIDHRAVMAETIDHAKDELNNVVEKIEGAVTGIGRLLSNKLTPDPDAKGDHTTFKRGSNGKVYKWETYEKTSSGNWDPRKRYDGGKPDGSAGKPHRDKSGNDVPTPHVQGKEVPEGARSPEPTEIPK